MRGDRPKSRRDEDKVRRFTPHARGSTSEGGLNMRVITVYPACAGIDPPRFGKVREVYRLPRMRGDRPSFFSWYSGASWFTPHARGSTLRGSWLSRWT